MFVCEQVSLCALTTDNTSSQSYCMYSVVDLYVYMYILLTYTSLQLILLCDVVLCYLSSQLVEHLTELRVYGSQLVICILYQLPHWNESTAGVCV